jgi:cytochrome c peroxidase
LLLGLAIAAGLYAGLLSGQDWDMTAVLDSMRELPAGLGALPALTVPAGNPQTPQKIALGKALFFDKQLSGDRSISCATCHDPEKGFSDGKPRAIGFNGKELPRHSPTVLNAAYNSLQFWDGRAASLEEQARGPIGSPAEMNLADEAELTRRLQADPRYQGKFQQIFGEGPSLNNVAKAIAAYERTLVTRNSRFDQYALGNKKVLTHQEKVGLSLFVGKARCSQCHSGPNFTDNKFYNLGVAEARDAGRYASTNQTDDLGAFKTPGLRDLARHAPYMHDGSLATLEAVIDYYDRGGDEAKNKSKLLLKLDLPREEKRALLAFLTTLNGELPGQPSSQMARGSKRGSKNDRQIRSSGDRIAGPSGQRSVCGREAAVLGDPACPDKWTEF